MAIKSKFKVWCCGIAVSNFYDCGHIESTDYGFDVLLCEDCTLRNDIGDVE